MRIYFYLFVLTFANVVPAGGQVRKPVVSLNQAGFNTGWPKRFTAPMATEGTPFIVTRNGNGKVLFRGTVKGGIGDFSAFEPGDENAEFSVSLTEGGKPTVVSYPFSIGDNFLQRRLFAPALGFMLDCRSVTGTHASAYGGCPWRDGTFYSFEVPSLVLQYLSNKEDFDAAPVEMNYLKDKLRVLDSGFRYVMDKEGQYALSSTRDYFTKIDPPVGASVPDIVQLMHWGIGFYMVNPVTQDPSGGTEGRRLHPQTLEQFAYFLYGFPYYRQFFTDRFYRQALGMAFDEWDKTGLLGIFNIVGDGKGREAPGHSILPNLLLYEVALREKREDAARYLDAAVKQAEWVVKMLDFKDPRTTKGQRMSEHKLVPALVYLLQRYPEKSPAGLQAKIDQWAQIAISRSENLWDFRRYDLDSNWSVPGFSETGNIAVFTGIALAASKVLTDDKTRTRLLELAVAAQDDLLGRNPQNAAAAHRPEMGFPGVERGWPKGYHDNVCARLETVRGSLSSISPTSMYPYNPDGKFGHLEGWTAFNAAWNVSLAYMNDAATVLECKADRRRKQLIIRLQKPVVFQTGKPRSVFLEAAGRKPVEIVLLPSGKGQEFVGQYSLDALPADSDITIRYGDALFNQQQIFILKL